LTWEALQRLTFLPSTEDAPGVKLNNGVFHLGFLPVVLPDDPAAESLFQSTRFEGEAVLGFIFNIHKWNQNWRNRSGKRKE
jgi:hypothetical protein